MVLNNISGVTFNELLEYGYKNLVAHYQTINDLNVFPVPDGDTGTNMKLTYANGLKSISDENASVSKIADEFARGMLFGARGNSGVLTSQYFRGFANNLANCVSLKVSDFARAMVGAYKSAYKACVDVTEGTILTVAREGIEKVDFQYDDDFVTFLKKVVEMMKISLDHTPELLPVLKENGVIDSGGKGLLTIFEGFLYFFLGKEISIEEETPFQKNKVEEKNNETIDFSAFNEDSVLEFGYCTEFLLQLQNAKIDIPSFQIEDFISWMQEHGESLVCFQTGTIVKTHIHTKKPYEVIEYAQRFGEFLTFKMENMALQHNNVLEENKKKIQDRKKLAYIAIAQGDGIIDLFKNLGCDVVLNGGQTMNTSVAEMIDAFKYVNADEIILLPNEANMCKAAHQAANLFKDGKVRVIDTKTMQEGYYILSMKAGLDEDDNLYDTLVETLPNVTTMTVFKSAKDASINDVVAPKGSYVESFGHHLVGFKNDLIQATNELLSKVDNLSDKGVCFIIYGQMVSSDVINALLDNLSQSYPNLEFGVVDGKQDVYDLLIGLM